MQITRQGTHLIHQQRAPLHNQSLLMQQTQQGRAPFLLNPPCSATMRRPSRPATQSGIAALWGLYRTA